MRPSHHAANAASAISHLPDFPALLADFDLNSGMLRFMLKIDNPYCITDAVESAAKMDENLWPQLVTQVDRLDVLGIDRWRGMRTCGDWMFYLNLLRGGLLAGELLVDPVVAQQLLFRGRRRRLCQGRQQHRLIAPDVAVGHLVAGRCVLGLDMAWRGGWPHWKPPRSTRWSPG